MSKLQKCQMMQGLSLSQNNVTVQLRLTPKTKKKPRSAGMSRSRQRMKWSCGEQLKSWAMMFIVTVTRGRPHSTPKQSRALLTVLEENTIKT